MTRVTEQQRRLEEELRIAHGELGEEARNEKNLEIERQRFKNATEADSKALVKITSELKGIEANEKEQKIKFVNEMESLNNESDFLLTHRANKKTAQLLDVENLKWLSETRLNTLVNSMVSGMDDTQVAEENEKWGEITAQVKEGLAGLAEIEDKNELLVKESNKLDQYFQQIRDKFLSENGNIGQMEIDDLEAKWEQQYACNDYEEEGNENTTSANGGNAVNNSLAVGGGGGSPVHMDLFYNNQEYDSSSVGYAC